MGNKMCERLKTAVDMLDQKKTLTKGEIVMVFKKVAEDLEQQDKQMGERMSRFEERLARFEEKFNNLDKKVDVGFAEIKQLISEKKEKTSFVDKIKSLGTKEALPFWICIIVIILGVFAILGVPLTEWKGIISSMNGG